MANISHGHTHAQQHKFAHRLTPNVRLVQELSHTHTHQIEQIINHELSQNHALEIDSDSSLFEQTKPEERDDDWNPDYDKPIDEYETGDASTSQKTDTIDFFDISANLEQAATLSFIENPERLEYALQCIYYYRIHGHLPEDADPQLFEDLEDLENSTSYQTLPSIYPTFEVIVEGDRVEANVIPIRLNLRYVRGLGPSSTSAKNFIKLLRDRNRLLNGLAYYILEILQGDFFRQNDFETALRYLLPVSADELNLLYKNSPFKLDVKYLSKLGDHLVSCRFGTFPLNYFIPSKAQIVRLWVNFATERGSFTKKEKLEWIRKQIERRVENLDLNDIRRKFILRLKDITINDIKYAQRIINT